MPDPVSGTGQARSGIQEVKKRIKYLDSGFHRNDSEDGFPGQAGE
jgi:hypothetical protein